MDDAFEALVTLDKITTAARDYVQSLIRLRDCDGGSFHERIFARDCALRELFVACGEANDDE